MAGANSVASVDPASTTKSYTKPTVYIAPAASITQSGELLRLVRYGTPMKSVPKKGAVLPQRDDNQVVREG
jgi:hypothetical protein